MKIQHYSALPPDTNGFLGATEFLDVDSPQVREFTEQAIGQAQTDRDKAIRLFYAVRDRIRYDPYQITFDETGYKASTVIDQQYGWCVPKAVLLAACARAAGIPAAIGLADVVNHLTTDKLRERMGGVDVFYDHGYAALYVQGRWLKLVPAFNIELCQRFGVHPTEFDGTGDALYQEFDVAGRKHMQYLADHGTWSDMPLQKVKDDFERYYPSIMARWRQAAKPSERFENDKRLF